jgi:hypothetical protein
MVATRRAAAAPPPPPPPAQATAYDQLLKNVPDDKFMLRRGALFELFARRRANPQLWTAERLAEHFNTRVEWVARYLNNNDFMGGP